MKVIYVLIFVFILPVVVFSQSGYVREFGNGLKIYNSGGKFGIKNSKDKSKLKAEYDSIGIYADLLQTVIVKKDNYYGLYDVYNFKFLIPVSCEDMCFRVKENKDYPIIIYKQKGKFGVVSTKGDKILAPLYDAIIYDFDTWRYIVKKGNKYGLYRSGEPALVVFKPEFDEILILKNQQSNIMLKVRKGDKYGIVACKNEYLEALYDNVEYFYGKCGSEVFIVENEGKYGWFSYSNNVAIVPEYDSVEPLNNGWAIAQKKGEFVVVENGGVINKIYNCDKAVLRKQEDNTFYYELIDGDTSIELEIVTLTKIRKK